MPLPERAGVNFMGQITQEVNQSGNLKVEELVYDYLLTFAEKGHVKPILQKLYAKREILSWLMGQNALLSDVKEGDEEVKQAAFFTNYKAMYAAVQSEIDSTEQQVGSTQAYCGVITATVPAPSLTGRFPANSPILLGDPNYPRWFRR